MAATQGKRTSSRDRPEEKEKEKRLRNSSPTTRRMLEALEEHGYELTGLFGRGSFSTVRRASSKRHNGPVAIKWIDQRQSDQRYVMKFLPRELSIVSQLHHANLIECYQIFESSSIVCIVEEAATHGDLLTLIRKRPLHRLDENDDARPLFGQIVDALHYLHRNHIAHRDVKCEAGPTVKLGDFGFSRRMLKDDISGTFCGSKTYAAPEILTGSCYSGTAMDIWSAGVILYVMLTGAMPFSSELNPREYVRRQMAKKYLYPRRLADTISAEAKLLIGEMLEPQPHKRPLPDDIRRHPWLLPRHSNLSTSTSSTTSSSSFTTDHTT